MRWDDEEALEEERDRLRDRLHGCLEERNAAGLALMGALTREISDTVEGVEALIADRDALRTDNARLRKALNKIGYVYTCPTCDADPVEIARVALSEEPS